VSTSTSTRSPAPPDDFLRSFAESFAAALPQSPGRALREYLDEWVERILETALVAGELVVTFDVGVDPLTSPPWHRLEGLLRSWTDRKAEPPWGGLQLALCASGEAGAVRDSMQSSAFEFPIQVGALEEDAVSDLVARFSLPGGSLEVRAVVDATGGDVGPLVACLHAMARDGLGAHDALDPRRNVALADVLAPLRRWLTEPRRMQVLRGVAAHPGAPLQGNARAVADSLATAGRVAMDRGGWRLRRSVYAALASAEPGS